MFAPVVPVSGYAGWKIFEKIGPRQFAAFAKTPSLQREASHFLQAAGAVTSAEALLSDRRLLAVALGAFGLETEIAKRGIVRRVLEESVSDPKSFANRLNDPRWRAFSEAFNFPDGARALSSAASRGDIAARFTERAFERAVGEADADIRLALNFRREIGPIANGVSADRAGWFQILGQQPLRLVIEGAFGLPEAFARLNIDRQRAILEEKSAELLGSRSPAAFLDKENVDSVLRRFFLARTAAQSAAASGPGAAALALLTGANGAPAAALVAANAAE